MLGENDGVIDATISNQSADPAEIAELLKPAGAPAPDDKAAAPAAPAAAVEGDDDDDTPHVTDPELDAAETEAERAQIIERRKDERRSRNQRRREKIEALERRMNSLAETNTRQAQEIAQLRQQGVGTQLAQLREAEGKAAQAIEHFKGIIADASTKGDGATVAEATQRMLEAQRYQEAIVAARGNFERTAAAPVAPHIDPLMVQNVRSFADKHKWYKGPRAQDPDSKVLTAIDSSLGSEGWDPTTDAYWQELETRAAKYLPHRFAAAPAAPEKPGYNGGAAANGQATQRQVPVAGSGSGASPGGSQGAGYVVSAERIKAMKEAGVWQDPARRAAMIKRYQESDRAAKRT